MIKVSQGCLGKEELAQVEDAFGYGYFGMASKVVEFEEKLAAYLGGGQAAAVNSGTSALHLALDALGLGPGDEVIVPSLTFVASFQAVSATGARPVACEVSGDTLLIDLDDVRNRITGRTKAIMPVHYGGNPCDMDSLLEIGREYNLKIVEDAAHAFGSFYKGKKIASFGDLTCFSFDSIKNITCGEGGAIVSRDNDLMELIKQKRLLGMDRKTHVSDWRERSWFYEVRTQGFRYHMSNINAAIGLAQLGKADAFAARRRQICLEYDAAFQSLPLIRCLNVNYTDVFPHIYVILVQNGQRNNLMSFLKERDIETAINYIPNHFHSFYKEEKTFLPVTEKVFEEILTLPLHCRLSDEDVEKVIEGVKSWASITTE